MVPSILFRLVIWFLLTADFGITNVIIGVLVALLLPPYNIFSKRDSSNTEEKIHELLTIFKHILIAIPQAYKESIEMIFTPHRHEEVVREAVHPNRSKLLIFLDTYVITFTPKAVVIKYNHRGWYEVHYVRRKAVDKVVSDS
ncbi:multisubunit sodium/proton antiporter, MrpE subunit [Cyanobacterium stanieri PCC 7202]|uniref:Multisubunit sodium/proton antiporter, MrpE subunit n=1 Tax=Cyanobacterium stanieri (strain ATCC 29140 / PCC 7202) TaxID=292563 RepID=K9YHU7_CYASC|nr:multisubunit sodium/proton antiporter, MrpE subunit [Cyanobacterium stanieri PCC 7202]